MVLASRAHQFSEPVSLRRCTDRNAVGSHRSALRNEVSTASKTHSLLDSICHSKTLQSFSIVRSGDAIYVRVGDHDLTRKYGSPGAQTLRVATTYIHHNHNSQTLDNDIALLKLHGQAELREGVCLVCLPARGVSHTAGKRCTVTGYGYMGEGESFRKTIIHSFLLFSFFKFTFKSIVEFSCRVRVKQFIPIELQQVPSR